MRHFGSLVLSLVLAPAVWALAGFGLGEYGRARERVGADTQPQLIFALAALAAAGVLFALLIMPRLSPLGPTVVGLAVLGTIGWLAVDPASVQRAPLPRFLHDALASPALGYAVPLAIPLVATVFSPRRWRRFDPTPALYAGAPEPYDDPRRFSGLSQFDGLGGAAGAGGFEEPTRVDTQPGFSGPYHPAGYPVPPGYPPPSAGYPAAGSPPATYPPPATNYSPSGHTAPSSAPPDPDATQRW